MNKLATTNDHRGKVNSLHNGKHLSKFKTSGGTPVPRAAAGTTGRPGRRRDPGGDSVSGILGASREAARVGAGTGPGLRGGGRKGGSILLRVGSEPATATGATPVPVVRSQGVAAVRRRRPQRATSSTESIGETARQGRERIEFRRAPALQVGGELAWDV